jgi:hypothetical protein
LRLRAVSSNIRPQIEFLVMQRNRAIAIAAERKALEGRLLLAAGMLLLPALPLLLISP